jgi:hypothetical protein
MTSNNRTPLEAIEHDVFVTSEDARAFNRFIIWAFEEADVKLHDEFIKAAISTIIIYMEKYYGIGNEKIH